MRRPTKRRVAWAWCLAATPAIAADAVAEKPTDLSVTVYRAPQRSSGSIDLDNLGGFALISETRTVHLPAGVSRLRFEGVADGIEPASAIVTGLPGDVIEKNREGKLQSPSALVAASVGKSVTLLRTDKKTGKISRVAGTVRSDAGGGVVFQTSEGIEALRCSGLPETFSFSDAADLAATPSLSVQVRSSAPLTRTVTLSYLARGFDWAADYVATISADRQSMDLGAWVTLANGNGAGLPAAHTQVVAGRVNHENGETEPLDPGGRILAECWPRGSTSDGPEYLQRGREALGPATNALAAMAPFARMAMPAALQEEQLGDLKLYRVPGRTTVASRQSKQVRLLDRTAIPVSVIYGADLPANHPSPPLPASVLLRTRNSAANHLGLPLPSGRIAVYGMRGGERLLQHESGMRDLAVGEEVEIDMGESSDVAVAADVDRVDISNARTAAIQFELRLTLPQGVRLVRADHPVGEKNGRPIIRLTVPAEGSVSVRYRTRHGA